MSPIFRRALVPGIPFALSICLSALTVGKEVYWQDSGFYLVAVKDMAPLYPPGYVLYQVLCKAWTVLLFFVDFTLAAHLFSSLCVALAAGTIAAVSRELLHSKGRLLGLGEEPSGLPDWASAAAGCLLATGYTFWFAGLYAKGYALFYLILAQLLWRMARADATGSRREFTWVAALIGLSWASHPSAALFGAAFVAFVVAHRKAIGLKGIAGRTGRAAHLCQMPVLIP